MHSFSVRGRMAFVEADQGAKEGRMPVTCYICGRDFGTRSIAIHLPNCEKKWENEQEKLPKSQRREVPKPPQDFDKVLSGELKGKALQKLNQQASEEYNDSALAPCQFCGRTFLPKSLSSHQKMCTEHSPMAKLEKNKTYTSQAKSRVKYPTLKSKTKPSQNIQSDKKEPAKTVLTTNDNQERGEQQGQNIAEHPVQSLALDTSNTAQQNSCQKETMDEMASEKEMVDEMASDKEMVDKMASDKEMVDKMASEEELMEESSDSSKRSSMAESEDLSSPGSELTDPLELSHVPPASQLLANQFLAPAGHQPSTNQGHQPTSNRPPSGRGPGTFRKRGTFTFEEKTTAEVGVTKEELKRMIDESDILEEEEHRLQVKDLLKGYFREIRTLQLRSLLSGRVFEEEENWREAMEIMEEFIKLKTNN